MSVETVDETEGFVATSSDMPEPQAEEPKAEAAPASDTPEEKAATDESKTDEVEAKSEEGKEQDVIGDDKAAQDTVSKKQNRTQKRIDQVVRQREDAKRANEALQRRVDELEAGSKKEPEQKASEPRESDFENYDAYLDALDAHDKEQSQVATKEPETAKEDKGETSSELNDSQKTAMAVIKEAINGAEKPDDFEAVALNDEVPITGEMLEALAECDDPTKVMYHLGNNKDLAAEIAGGSAAQQARAIAKLDMSVEVKPSKPVKTTAAPDPISPVGGSDAQEKAPSDMSFSEYEKHMNSKEGKKRSNW